MESTWIVTANAGNAHFYSVTNTNPPLEQKNSLVNPYASLQTVDTESDKLGLHAASKSKHSTGQPTQPSGYQPNQSPAEHHAELFARSVAGFLLRSHQQGLFNRLILTASPEFLGVLRQVMDAGVRAVIANEIAKDYTRFQGKDLCELVKARRKAA
ncbi:MAG TPA: host attachment protein [Cellvibrio sp.]|nr:host attachment protein [Cellvibrio sp.]